MGIHEHLAGYLVTEHGDREDSLRHGLMGWRYWDMRGTMRSPKHFDIQCNLLLQLLEVGVGLE